VGEILDGINKINRIGEETRRGRPYGLPSELIFYWRRPVGLMPTPVEHSQGDIP
jgi:hypothetical protein